MKYILFFLFTPFFIFSQVQIGNDIDAKTQGDLFGYDIALSDDGNILAVSSPNNDDNGQGTGLVQVFENIGGSWIQKGQDLNEQVLNSLQPDGLSVDLTSDGNRLVVGAAFNQANGLGSAGQVKIYDFINGSWVQVGQTIDGLISLNLLGYDVSISSNGTIVAASGIASNGGNFGGQVKVFGYNAGTWNQLGQSLNGSSDEEMFGLSISLSSNGNILAIGAPRYDNNLLAEGLVRIYQFNGSNWVQLGQDIYGLDNNYRFGTSVSLSSDGNIVAAGAPNAPGAGIVGGHTRVFENINGSWTQIGQLIPSESNQDSSGNAVSLSSNGNIVAIGALYNSGNGTESGHVRIFENQSGNWMQIGSDIDGEAAEDFFGYSVSISSNGGIVAAGAIYNDDVGFNSGHVRVYDLNQVLSIVDSAILSFKIFPNPTKNRFIVQLNDQSQLKHINVYNTVGQLVLTSKGTVINTSKLTQGIYTVVIHTTKGKGTKKLIIE